MGFRQLHRMKDLGLCENLKNGHKGFAQLIYDAYTYLQDTDADDKDIKEVKEFFDDFSELRSKIQEVCDILEKYAGKGDKEELDSSAKHGVRVKLSRVTHEV